MKTMKRMTAICLAVMLLAGCCAAAAETGETPRMILYTVYQYLGPDGLYLQAGVVDEEGGRWTLDTLVPDPDWNTGMDEYLAALLEAGKLTYAGKIEKIDIFDVESLVISVEDRGNESEAVCEGAGCESSWALDRKRDGSVRKVLLGVSGDSKFENTDPDAQALYRLLRENFPGVDNYAYSDMGPRGFQPVSILEFRGWQDIDFSNAAISCADINCLEGPIDVELTDADKERVLQLVTEGVVTGKANSVSTTGGMTDYWFTDAEGNYLCGIELYEGLMVTNDGMWYISD